MRSASPLGGLGADFTKLLSIRSGIVAQLQPTAVQGEAANVDVYGQNAALLIMQRVKALPENLRVDFLKRTINAIDPGLWQPINTLAETYMKAGNPALGSYLAALSQNLTVGTLARMTALGMQSQNLSGFGAVTVGTPLQFVIPSAPAPGECSADSKFIWDAGGYWRRIRVGETCQTVGASKVDVRTEGQGGVSVTPTTMISCGPFSFPAARSETTWAFDDYATLTPEQAAFIKTAIQKQLPITESNWTQRRQGPEADPEPGTTSVMPTYQSGQPTGYVISATWPPTAPWGPEGWLTYGGWFTRFGIVKGDSYDARYFGFDRSRFSPIAQFKNPVNGEDWGLWIRLNPVGPTIKATSASMTSPEGVAPIDYSTQSFALQFMAAPLPDTNAVWQWIKQHVAAVVAKFYDFVIDIGKEISDLLCAIANNPASAVGAATTAGGPAAGGAAAAGALILADRCKAPTPPAPPVPDTPPQPQTPWGLIAAGAVAVLGVAAFMLAPRKRAQP